MAEDNGGTLVDVATDLSITGKVAQFGRGVLADVSSKLMKQFVENLEGDVLSGSNGSGAESDSAEAPTREFNEGPRRIESAPAEPVDLLDVAGAPMAKRVVPVIVGVVVLFVLWRLLRRGSRD
jgi:hypothetical protein